MKVRLWAPRARDVALEVDSTVSPVVPDPQHRGWYVSVTDLRHGTDYHVVVDGDRLTDPLARWAPYGVHGPARVLDPSTFAWRDSGWKGTALGQESLLYELHVGTFTAQGTLLAAADRLRHLHELGVSHIELLPLAAFDGPRGWGYDGVLLNAVHEAYGGPEQLVTFVDRAHELGIAVVLDVVHNHLGPSGNSWERFGPFFTDRHHTPWGQAVNLDAPGSDDVRRILLDSALGWVRDYHLDGLRLDAVHELHDSRATSFLEELSAEVEALSDQLERPLALIAETDRNDPRTVTSRDAGGLGMTAQWDDDVHHALHWLLTGESSGYYADFASPAAVALTLRNTFLHDGRWSTFRGRTHGRPVDPCATPPSRFVVALQTHDQVGNRARGERLSQLVRPDLAAAGAALLLGLPYVPMLFMGEEWGAGTPWCFFSSFEDPDLARSVTLGRRNEFADHGWSEGTVPDPQDPDTHARSVLDWSERITDEGSRMLTWYHDLLRLRRARPELTAPTSCWGPGQEGRPDWWALLSDGWLTCANLSETMPVALQLTATTSARTRVQLAWAGGGGAVGFQLSGEASVLVLDPGTTVVASGVSKVGAEGGTRTPTPWGDGA